MHQLRRQHSRARQQGFTLVEIMVVIVILGLLVGIVAPNLLGQQAQAQIDTAKMDVRSIYDNVELYMAQNRQRIPTWEDLTTPNDKGYTYIKGLKGAKKDPWGNEYVITEDPEFNHLPFVYSWGPNKADDGGGDDDITNKNLMDDEDN